MDIKILGIDLGKTVYSLAGLDEPGAVFVTLTVEYRTEQFLGVPQMIYHRFIDFAPEFELSQSYIEEFWDMPRARFTIHHGEVPAAVPVSTHLQSVRVQ